jgi:hypothetical protein
MLLDMTLNQIQALTVLLLLHSVASILTLDPLRLHSDLLNNRPLIFPVSLAPCHQGICDIFKILMFPLPIFYRPLLLNLDSGHGFPITKCGPQETGMDHRHIIKRLNFLHNY